MKVFFKKIYDYYFHHMKLKSKFMFSHLLLALAPTFVFAIFAYNQLFHILTNNTLQSLLVISDQTVNSVNSSISHLNTVIDNLKANETFQDFLINPDQTNETFFQELQNFTNTTELLNEDSSISALRIYLEDPHYQTIQSISSSDLYLPMIKAKGTYWNGIFSSSDRRTLFCPSDYLSPSEISTYGELAIIHKITIETAQNQITAYIALYFSQDVLDSILLQDIPFTNSLIYILNERDSIVATSNSTLSGLYHLPYASIPEAIRSTYNFKSLDVSGDKVYMGYKRITGTDWYMVTVIPSDNVLEDGRTLLFQFIAMYIVMLLAGSIIALTLSNSIIKRISTIVNQMKKVRSSPPVHLRAETSRDEIGDLVDTYNYMTDEINKLMEQQLKAANDLRNSEFKALQSQINPHFLYNTLDMINWMAKTGKSEDVSEAVQILSRFYKLTFNKGNNIVKVKDELDHVSLYVQLQNMRYNGKIHFFVDVPDEMMYYEIPKLIFQPIVENAIQHGIFGKEEKEGNIVIMGWQESDTLVFVVSDDGIGIPPEKMAHLLDGTVKSDTGSSIGIYNTHRRLQLYYDTQFGLSYRSEPDTETEVEIRIPARKFEN